MSEEENKTLKMKLIERSSVIKMRVEKILRELDKPISLSELVRQVNASRLPVEKHVVRLIATNEINGLQMHRVGTVFVIYKCPYKANEER